MEKGFWLGAAVVSTVAVVLLIFFHKWAQQLPLLEAQQSFESVFVFFEKLFGFFGLMLVFRVVKHGGAQAILPVFAHQYVVVHTAFATGPEVFVLGELGIGDGLVTEFAVNLHHSQPGGEAENFGVGIFFPRQFEDSFFDSPCHAGFSECRRHDETAVGYVPAVAPCFNITKAYPHAISSSGDDSLAFIYFVGYILRAAFGNAGTTGFGAFGYFGGDGFGVANISGSSYTNDYILIVQL